MKGALSYAEIISRKEEIMLSSVGIDYASYSRGLLAFDYEKMLADTGYDIEGIAAIQAETAVGSTPLVELRR